MSELISGKEALIALANGKKLQARDAHAWKDVTSDVPLSIFDMPMIMFRLKPRTITINGFDVPAPFEPKDWDEFWILFESHYSPCGYKLVLPDSQYSELCYGAWRTEEEIKQVVEALRSIFKC